MSPPRPHIGALTTIRAATSKHSEWLGAGRAVQDQTDDIVKDALATALPRIASGRGRAECEECAEPIPQARRGARPGVRTRIAGQPSRDKKRAFPTSTRAVTRTARCVDGGQVGYDLIGVYWRHERPRPTLKQLKLSSLAGSQF